VPHGTKLHIYVTLTIYGKCFSKCNVRFLYTICTSFYGFHCVTGRLFCNIISTLPFDQCRFSVFFAVDREEIIIFKIICQGGANVHVDTVLKTPQFWLLFTTSTLLATVIS